MTLSSAFPDYSDDVPTMPTGFKASHWKNDACPSWRRADLVIWVNYADPERRECGGGRFTLEREESDGATTLLVSSDDWQDVLAALK